MKRTKLNLIKKETLPEESEYLWRYMDLHKFINFIDHQKIRFSRMDEFEDPLEGIPYQILEIARRSGNVGNLGDFVLGEYEPLIKIKSTGGLANRTDQIFINQKTHFVSCWFQDSSESMAMWNLYSNESGVAIRVKFSDLVADLEPDYDESKIIEYYCGKVDYQNLRDIDPFSPETLRKIKRLALRKDRSYAHENEIRFVLKTTSECKGIFSTELNLKRLDFKVIPHPKMQEWQINNLKMITQTKKLNECLIPSSIRLR